MAAAASGSRTSDAGGRSSRPGKKCRVCTDFKTWTKVQSTQKQVGMLTK